MTIVMVLVALEDKTLCPLPLGVLRGCTLESGISKQQATTTKQKANVEWILVFLFIKIMKSHHIITTQSLSTLKCYPPSFLNFLPPFLFFSE